MGTYKTSKTSAMVPEAIGQEALVPSNSLVH